MRKYIALIVGMALAIGGAWGLYFLLFEAAAFYGLFSIGAGIVAAMGGWLVWDTLRN